MRYDRVGWPLEPRVWGRPIRNPATGTVALRADRGAMSGNASDGLRVRKHVIGSGEEASVFPGAEYSMLIFGCVDSNNF